MKTTITRSKQDIILTKSGTFCPGGGRGEGDKIFRDGPFHGIFDPMFSPAYVFPSSPVLVCKLLDRIGPIQQHKEAAKVANGGY